MNILLLDDHSLFSAGLEKILEEYFEGVNLLMFKSIADLSRANLVFKDYDLFITDIELPGEDTFEFLKDTKSRFPSLPILVLSMHNKLSVIKKCKHLKIEGYILKDEHELFVPVVEKLLSGETYYSDKVEETLSILKLNVKLLTPREEEILAMMADGKTNNQIAEQLFVSYNTIVTHGKNIRGKLKLSSSAKLIRYYFENYLE
jgi:DNA-binding NarL/FixJ family response regulator